MLKKERLRGREGAPDYVEVVFTRGGDGGDCSAAASSPSSSWSPQEIGRLHLDYGVNVQCAATLPMELPNGGNEISVSSGDGGGGGGGEKGQRHGGEGDGADGKAAAAAAVDTVDGVSAFLACLRTDRPDGLFTTVVCDTTGIALGLVRRKERRGFIVGRTGGKEEGTGGKEGRGGGALRNTKGIALGLMKRKKNTDTVQYWVF